MDCSAPQSHRAGEILVWYLSSWQGWYLSSLTDRRAGPVGWAAEPRCEPGSQGKQDGRWDGGGPAHALLGPWAGSRQTARCHRGLEGRQRPARERAGSGLLTCWACSPGCPSRAPGPDLEGSRAAPTLSQRSPAGPGAASAPSWWCCRGLRREEDSWSLFGPRRKVRAHPRSLPTGFLTSSDRGLNWWRGGFRWPRMWVPVSQGAPRPHQWGERVCAGRECTGWPWRWVSLTLTG